MRFAAFAGSLTVAAILLAGAGAARSGAQPVVDRTYRCLVPPVYDQVREINLGVSPRHEATAAGVGARPASVWVGARRGGYGERSFFSVQFGPGNREASGSISIDPEACGQLAKTRVPLVSRGLPAAPVLFEQYVACPATRAVLVRLRALVDRTPRWRRSSGYVTANVNVLEGELAVRSLAQTPIGFVAVSRSGASETYLSPRCD